MPAAPVLPEVAPLRQASREIVRELGMLDGRFAPADVTHSQCHALVELEREGALSVGEIAERLRLDKSVASRVLRSLEQRKLVRVREDDGDRRVRRASLTASGRKVVARVHAAANDRVDAALRQLGEAERARVLEGLSLYARALAKARRAGEVEIRPIRAADDHVIAEIIRTVMTEHGAVGPGFAIVDPEVSCMSQAYADHIEPPARYFVLARSGEVIGGAGFAPLAGGDPAVCELRKMYLRPTVRGAGLGRRLLAHLLDQARAAGYARCYLETMATMLRARALYESVGFERLSCALGRTGHYGCDAWYARDL
jgi:putative acetyltransferase